LYIEKTDARPPSQPMDLPAMVANEHGIFRFSCISIGERRFKPSATRPFDGEVAAKIFDATDSGTFEQLRGNNGWVNATIEVDSKPVTVLLKKTIYDLPFAAENIRKAFQAAEQRAVRTSYN
jgi:hypothetical protein